MRQRSRQKGVGLSRRVGKFSRKQKTGLCDAMVPAAKVHDKRLQVKADGWSGGKGKAERSEKPNSRRVGIEWHGRESGGAAETVRAKREVMIPMIALGNGKGFWESSCLLERTRVGREKAGWRRQKSVVEKCRRCHRSPPLLCRDGHPYRPFFTPPPGEGAEGFSRNGQGKNSKPNIQRNRPESARDTVLTVRKRNLNADVVRNPQNLGKCFSKCLEII
ncbi:potassium voltage-gated channel subfamily H member 7-like protein [Anopheles sinensis]|uniref:Potassium voltage-gated channel subfamily H member 7-like protein n=1 Tax=Anopheles sinensis TaxID=74873 RepID=A0A084VYJ4_ANOSI|nr:potassium voltage-gated channel subfamily H member 7-like protein [Anopheles sinensis]